MDRTEDLRQPVNRQVILVTNDFENVFSYKYLLDNCFFLAESCVDFYGDNCINITYSYVS